MSFKDKLNPEKLPEHVAIIMDGNGRWAKQKGNQRIFGHKHGAISAKEVVEAAMESGVKYLTLYAFSTENWKRPQAEIDALMGLLISSINNEANKMIDNNIRLLTIGDKTHLPKEVCNEIDKVVDQSKNNTGLTLVIAISYSSYWEILDAVKKIAHDAKSGALNTEEIDENVFGKYLSTDGIPNPDLLIRTSGELRISNFLLWQLAYAELYFTEKLWPDFRKEDFFEALYDYQKRERRYGKTSEQINIEK